MVEFITLILSNSGRSLETVFLVLFLVMFYLLRTDAKEHKKEYKDTVRQMFDVVNQNTQSNTKLGQSIDNLRERINDQNRRS